MRPDEQQSNKKTDRRRTIIKNDTDNKSKNNQKNRNLGNKKEWGDYEEQCQEIMQIKNNKHNMHKKKHYKNKTNNKLQQEPDIQKDHNGNGWLKQEEGISSWGRKSNSSNSKKKSSSTNIISCEILFIQK